MHTFVFFIHSREELRELWVSKLGQLGREGGLLHHVLADNRADIRDGAARQREAVLDAGCADAGKAFVGPADGVGGHDQLLGRHPYRPKTRG